MRTQFSPAAYAQAKAITTDSAELEARPAVQGIMIDSATTKDRDDAIWITATETGYRVDVSIADVAGFVEKDTPLDKEVTDRATTTYHWWGNDPMLPRVLSEENLSLTPNRTRPTVTASIELDQDLNIVDVTLRKTRLEDSRAMTYDQVSSEIFREDSLLHGWSQLAERLLDKRRAEGALAVYDKKTGTYVTGDGEVLRLRARTAYAQILVQEMMILANKAVAGLMEKEGVPILYRNHAARVGKGRGQSITTLRELSEQDGVDVAAVRQTLLQDFERASLSAKNTGHLGLNIPAYCWWTSPIRRRCDLLNHRQVNAYLDGQTLPYTQEELEEAGQDINEKTQINERKTNEFFAEKVNAKIETAISEGNAAALERLDSKEFAILLSTFINSGEVSEERREIIGAEIARRVEEGAMRGKDMIRIMVDTKNDDEMWPPIKEKVLERLERRPNEAVVMLTEASQNKADWHGSNFSSRQAGNYFSGRVTVSVGDNELAIPVAAIGKRKAEAEQYAAVAFWRNAVAGTLVSPEETQECDLSQAPKILRDRAELIDREAGINTFMKLNQLCVAKGLELDINIIKKGKARSPSFSVEATISGDAVGEPITVRGPNAMSHSAAKIAVAEKLFEDERLKTLLEEPLIPLAAAHQKNPVSTLTEITQKRGWTVQESSKMTGPSHMPEITVTLTITGKGLEQPIIVEGKARSKKDAKVVAANNFLSDKRHTIPTKTVSATGATPSAMLASGKNPVSAMMELAQVHGWTVKESPQQSGPSHQPTFSMTLTISGEGLDKDIVVDGAGTSKKAAKAEAAKKFLDEVPEISQTAETSTVATSKNPVSVLNEMTQQKGWKFADDYKAHGPAHNQSFVATVTISGGDLNEPITVSGDEGNKQTAKASAVKNALAVYTLSQVQEHLEGQDGAQALLSAVKRAKDSLLANRQSAFSVAIEDAEAALTDANLDMSLTASLEIVISDMSAGRTTSGFSIGGRG